jgi:hypothetical protein
VRGLGDQASVWTPLGAEGDGLQYGAAELGLHTWSADAVDGEALQGLRIPGN